jgi:hypothetical protein
MFIVMRTAFVRIAAKRLMAERVLEQSGCCWM